MGLSGFALHKLNAFKVNYIDCLIVFSKRIAHNPGKMGNLCIYHLLKSNPIFYLLY